MARGIARCRDFWGQPPHRDDAVADREVDEFGAALDALLAHDLVFVELDGARRDRETGGQVMKIPGLPLHPAAATGARRPTMVSLPDFKGRYALFPMLDGRLRIARPAHHRNRPADLGDHRAGVERHAPRGGRRQAHENAPPLHEPLRPPARSVRYFPWTRPLFWPPASL